MKTETVKRIILSAGTHYVERNFSCTVDGKQVLNIVTDLVVAQDEEFPEMVIPVHHCLIGQKPVSNFKGMTVADIAADLYFEENKYQAKRAQHKLDYQFLRYDSALKIAVAITRGLFFAKPRYVSE